MSRTAGTLRVVTDGETTLLNAQEVEVDETTGLIQKRTMRMVRGENGFALQNTVETVGVVLPPQPPRPAPYRESYRPALMAREEPKLACNYIIQDKIELMISRCFLPCTFNAMLLVIIQLVLWLVFILCIFFTALGMVLCHSKSLIFYGSILSLVILAVLILISCQCAAFGCLKKKFNRRRNCFSFLYLLTSILVLFLIFLLAVDTALIVDNFHEIVSLKTCGYSFSLLIVAALSYFLIIITVLLWGICMWIKRDRS
jgi:hypothetical protein